MQRLLFIAIMWLATFSALADTRTTLSKDAVAMGEPVVLTIDTDQPVASPNLAPLRVDFAIGDVSSSRQFGIDSNGVRANQQIRVVLRPLRSGMLAIPALDIGNQRTAPLMLEVLASGNTRPTAPGRASTGSTRADGPVFIDTVFDDANPYVQQAIGVTVRLHYAINLFNGEFRQPEPPDGASLQPVGNDSRSMRVVNGRQYQVLERHYLLVPERSGPLRIPGASFTGQGESGFFEDLFGDGRELVSAEAPSRTLQVRPIPASAGTPWLPARQVSLRVNAPPSSARAGEAFDVVVELRADGVTGTQLPELQMSGPGAQVFAQPAQSTDGFGNGRPNVVTTRRFSIVPQQAGTLRLQVAPVVWWDVASDTARRANVAPLVVQVSPGAGGAAMPGPVDDAAQRSDAQNEATSNHSPWYRKSPWIVGALALSLVLLFVVWASRRRRVVDNADSYGDGVDARGAAVAVNPKQAASTNKKDGVAPATLADLHRAIAAGDLSAVARLLPALAEPPVSTLAEARERLDGDAQVVAASQLESALWGNGDADAARDLLRKAFAKGPRWKAPPTKSKPLLPPLYPEH